MVKIEERRISMPPDIWESLKYYAHDEAARVAEDIRGAITPQSIAVEILRNHLTRQGHYPPKTGKEEKPAELFEH